VWQWVKPHTKNEADPGTRNKVVRMERVTLRIPEEQVRAVETLVEEGEFPNRSEAIRAAVRTMVTEKDGKEKLKESQRIARV